MARVWNFSAGPSALPEAVLTQAASEMLDWRGCGMSVMEMSHRSAQFGDICDTAESDLRELLGVPNDYAVLFMQGGATAENAIVPMNLIARRRAHANRHANTPAADFVVTGHWSARSAKEAARYGDARIAASNDTEARIDGVTYAPRTWWPAPDTWQVRADASYLHLCSNETIGGLECADWPTLDIPLVVDASSHFLSRPMDVTRAGMVYAGAQKNAGPAGVTVVIVHRELIGHALPVCPSAFDYANVAQERSRYNTPPTYAIYIAGLVFQWLKAQGGLVAVEAANRAKAELLYAALDASPFYRNPVHPPARSRMNVPFVLSDPALDKTFLAGAEEAGLSQLKGHKSTGGMRASIYNAMPLAGVQALVDYLQEFERRHG